MNRADGENSVFRSGVTARIESFFLERSAVSLEDEFEVAKASITARFAVFFFILCLAMLPIIMTYDVRLFAYLNIIGVVSYIAPLVLLRRGAHYTKAAAALCAALYIATTMNAFMTNGTLSMTVTVWYILLISFSGYVLPHRWAVFIVIAVFTTAALLSVGRFFHLFQLNPFYSPDRDSLMAAVSLLMTAPLICKLTLEYSRTKQAAVDRLRRTIESKNAVLGVVAHDLRNSLGAINNVVELMECELADENPEGALSLLPIIKEAGGNSMEQITELVIAAEAESRDRPLICEMVDLNAFVQSAVDMNLAGARRKGIAVSFAHERNPVFARLDKMRFSRVISNLLSNAVKFTHRGGRIEVRVIVSDVAGSVELRVADTGVGIPEELQDRLFEPFTSAGRPGTEQEKSFGLGMSIVKRLVEQHGGKISFRSSTASEKHGTEFVVSLPVVELSAVEDTETSPVSCSIPPARST